MSLSKTLICELIYFNTSLILISSFHILDRPDMVNASTIGFEFLSFFDIRITWERPNDNFNEINEYQLKIVLLSSISPSSPTAPVFEFNTPEPNFNYTINITACNDVGCGDVSETVKFTSITPSLSVCLCLSACLFIPTFISIYPSVPLSHLILFLLGLAKLMDVRTPRALINATSFFLIWAYPELALNPPNGENASIKEVQITYKPEGGNEDTVTESSSSLNVTIGGLFSDRIYTITVRVVYDRPNLIGEGVVLNIQTLPEGVSIICTCTCT